MKSIITLLLILCLFTRLSAQDEGMRNIDYVYTENIHTVQLHLPALPLSYPIVDLNSGYLSFSFDDLDADTKNYSYTITLCDADWTPSRLSTFEYIDGFDEDKIRDFHFAYSTLTPYTHYTLDLPNDNLKWTKSGNYLLKVYEDSGDKKLVITRRFMVTEPVFKINAETRFPADVGKSRTHQELDFVVSHKGIPISSPRTDVRATVLQNGRWDNAITDIAPFSFRTDELVFDYQDKIVFPAGKEFRWADLRSYRFRTNTVRAIEEYNHSYYFTMFQDLIRYADAYLFTEDINGKYVIGNKEYDDPDLSSDYVHVLFSLGVKTPFDDGDVYIIGKMSDWLADERFKMQYSEIRREYEADVLLKQGYYDYIYAVAPNGKKELDFEATEGNWQETNNDYTIIVYYRPFGARYDRIMAVQTVASNNRK